MHDAAFAAAARPMRHVILGLPMLPYSIGHEIQLLSKSNPLLFSSFDSLGKLQQRVAISRACLVCCRNWADSFTAHRWLRLWRWRNKRSDFALAIADWRNYRQAGSVFPNTPTEEAVTITSKPDETSGRSLGSPHLARLYNFISALPLNQLREMIPPGGNGALDIPLGWANYLYAAASESEGGLKVENFREAEIRLEMEGHRKFYADKKAKEATCPPS